MRTNIMEKQFVWWTHSPGRSQHHKTMILQFSKQTNMERKNHETTPHEAPGNKKTVFALNDFEIRKETFILYGKTQW